MVGFPAKAQADAPSQGQFVIIGEGHDPGIINRHVSAFVEPDDPLAIAEILQPDMQSRFQKIETIEPDFGYTLSGIWLKLDVRNMSETPLRRYLMLHTNFMSEIRVYLDNGNTRTLLLEQDQQSVFGSRPVPYHELVAPFEMAGQQSATIYIRYASNGNTVLPLSVVDEVALATKTNRQLIVDFSFYGLMAMVILVSLLGRIFFPNPTFLAYASYVTGVLLLIFQRDGYAFQFLWPNAPAWNDFSTLPLGAALPLLAAIFTRSYLQTKSLHPQIDKVLLAICGLQVALVALSPVIGVSAAKQWALITVSLSIIVFISIGIIAYRQYGRRTLFFLIGWLGLLTGTVVMSMIHWLEVDITRAQSLDIMRVSMVFDALMMGLASVFSVVNLQKDHAKLSAERLDILETNVRLHDRFARLEQKYQIAQEIAQSRNEQLTDLTHDLRQPLFALRSSVSSFSTGSAPGMNLPDIEQSFEYIESLVESALSESIDSEESGELLPDHDQERTPVNKLFSSLETMFAAEVAQQQAKLRFVDSSAIVLQAPFPILRIISNFLSNAIRYAPQSRILVGCRDRGDMLSIEVHDKGPGMSSAELAKVRQRLARGDDAAIEDSGRGVGLSIVGKIADELGLEWSIDSEPGKGTSAALLVPKV
ncbi:MAG: sensor histidine kinase [Pseudomonadota bacterium]